MSQVGSGVSKAGSKRKTIGTIGNLGHLKLQNQAMDMGNGTTTIFPKAKN